MNGLGRKIICLLSAFKDPLEIMVMNLTDISQCDSGLVWFWFCPIIGCKDTGSE